MQYAAKVLERHPPEMLLSTFGGLPHRVAPIKKHFSRGNCSHNPQKGGKNVHFD